VPDLKVQTQIYDII